MIKGKIDKDTAIKNTKKKLESQAKKIENRKEVKKVKKVMSDFKSFAMKGNIIDMATGVIIGTSFTKIVNSLVSEIITPLMSKLTGKVDLNDLFFALDGGTFSSIAEAKEAGSVTVNYGVFLSNIIDFLIIAFTIFIFLRYTFNKRSKIVEKTPVVSTKTCPYCITEISLKATKCPNCTSELVGK